MLYFGNVLFQIKHKESPISRIFQGQMRSSVFKTGAKESATLQPFLSLQLDIQVCVREAVVSFTIGYHDGSSLYQVRIDL